MRVTCDNQLCVYWSDGACALGRISLDYQGSCTDCLLVSLPEELLAQKRRELLDELEKREARWKEQSRF